MNIDLGRRTAGQWWQHQEPFVNARVDSVRELCIEAYRKAGAGTDEAGFLAATNLDKAIQGDHARGLNRVPPLVRSALEGRIDLRATPAVRRDGPGFALVDGGPLASGRLVCRQAMLLAIEKARANGIAFVGVQHQGELLTRYIQIAAEVGTIGIVFNQSFPTVAPHGGAGALLGNQPLAIGIPAGRHDPILLDMSFTQSSAAGMFLAATQRQTVAPGLLLDEAGEPSIRAEDFPSRESYALGPDARGSLTPLGNNHKGYAMVFVLSLLSAVLTDTSPPWELFYRLKKRGRYGTVMIAIDPAVILPIEEFRRRVDDFIDNVKAAKRRKGVEEILYPGEGSQRLRREREALGVFALPESHFRALCAMADELGFDRPRLAE
jgi:LDH2 family malate/lactate/ureidoglycolate dehydrogenase